MLFTINKNLLIDSFLPQIIILIAMNLKMISMRFVDDCARNVCEVETWQLSPIKLRLQQHTSSELRIFFHVNKILIGNKPKNHPVFRDGLPGAGNLGNSCILGTFGPAAHPLVQKFHIF